MTLFIEIIFYVSTVFNHFLWLTGDASNASVGSGDGTDGCGVTNKSPNQKLTNYSLTRLTVKCWNNHALKIFVATLEKMPRFLCLFLLVGSSSLQPSVPSPLPTLALLASPVNQINDWKTFKNWMILTNMVKI